MIAFSLAIAAIFMSLCAFVLSLRAFMYHRHEATLVADSNIISYVTSVLELLERVDKLDPQERGLFIGLLEDSGFFEASKEGDLKPYYDVWPVDELLRKHFGVKSRLDIGHASDREAHGSAPNSPALRSGE